MPTPDILERQPRWIWFMIWPDFLEKDYTPEGIRAIYEDPGVFFRE